MVKIMGIQIERQDFTEKKRSNNDQLTELLQKRYQIDMEIKKLLDQVYDNVN